jgi:dimethylaniline monooxygenase (N-oxide forming)
MISSSSVEGNEGSVAFLMFGFLGAMGASFVIWVPLLYNSNNIRECRRKKRSSGGNTSISLSYVISSIIAFVSILNLQPCIPSSIQECTPDEGFGTFHPNFRQWLQCLHVILITPIILSYASYYLLPMRVANALMEVIPRINSCVLFGFLSATCAVWHAYQIMKEGAKYIVPITDCQLSITTDLICCSCITLYAVYKDSLLVNGSGRSRGNHHYGALRTMCIAAIIMPLISPAAVIAGHLCLIRLDESYGSLIAYVQRRVADKRRCNEITVKYGGAATGAMNGKKKGKNSSPTKGTTGKKSEVSTNWCNLGLWTQQSGDTPLSYNQACQNLAHALGKAANLNSNDAILSCGCGSIDEVRYFKSTFDLRHATGIDPHLPKASLDEIIGGDFNVRSVRASIEDLTGYINEEQLKPLFPPHIFDKILALDSVYHYPCKRSFLSDCFHMLPGSTTGSDGEKVVAVSDIVLRKHCNDTPLWVKVALRLTGIPICNLWSVKEYRNNLTSIGYNEDISVQLVGKDVFKGWSAYLPKCLLDHIDYALIVAKKPNIKSNLPPLKKKRVAIIGSGLAGLSSAHYLLTSKEATNVDVDIYEAGDCTGLAGNTTLIGDQLVDVPARMAALGYYNEYQKLLNELDIPTVVVRTDSSFYGDDGHGSQVCYEYSQSSFANIYNAIFVGGLGKLLQLIIALRKLKCEDSEDEDSSEGKVTFGEWLQRNLGVSTEKSYTCDSTGAKKEHDLPSLTCHTNPFAYIICGSLSWMLSCRWADLLEYPADIVLPYCRGLRMDRLGAGRQGQVIRVVPSIKALEARLLYGVRKLHLGMRVCNIDDTKVINGVTYDAVIVATEARAVPKIVAECSDVFEKITYHPSTIYLHTDESFMPKNRKDWKCWNVEMSSGRQEPQLTFWLNEFYPDSRFGATNVFQIWAPSRPPQKEKIIRRYDFERVVHSKDTRTLIAGINDEQGKNGIYYAGSYCIYGMGLLEQALISGKDVSKMVLNDLVGVCSVPLPAKAPIPLKALVIGAGPSGLVTAKYLLESTFPVYDVTVVESSNKVGGSFVNKTYDFCHLVSSKYLTAFSDHRMSEDTASCPDHPSAAQYCEYLQTYAERFGLLDKIKFGCAVVSVKDADTTCKQGDSDEYEVQYENSDYKLITGKFDIVAVCSGLHNSAFVPTLFTPSNDFATKFKGQIIHSCQYKEASIFTNKRVLILGCGETAMDLAYRAINNSRTQSVALSVRRGLLSIPHNLAKDRPLDVFITNLFEHAYEHPWVHSLRLRWVLSTIIIRLFLLLSGSSVGFNQWAVQTSPVARGYHIINKSHAAMSHLNVPIKSQSMWGRFWMWVYQESGLRPIESFHQTEVVGVDDDGVTVRFCDGRKYEADLIVLATGYKQSFPFLDDNIRKEFMEESLQAQSCDGCKGDVSSYKLEEHYLPSQHFIVGKNRPRLGFIGFVRPNVGAIPPMSELQVMWWLERMKGAVNMLPNSDPPSYMVLGRKYPYGVDYGSYMHRVAEDFGAAPTLTTLSKSSHPFKALYTYCIGQSMISLFRLQGPYASAVCWEVVTGELWRVCLKRGLAENCGLLFMTWLSFLMNMTACVLECIWCMCTLSQPKLFERY